MYDAFISYSHAKDAAVATRLQSVMQNLGKAWWQRRRLRIFRDETSLTASPELWPSIEKALTSSRYLVLMASADSARSPWVAREVETWLAMKGPEKGSRTLLIALTDGELAWDHALGDFSAPAWSCLPASLKGKFPAEPLWIDLRAFRDCDARALRKNRDFKVRAAKIAAAVLGLPPEDLYSEEMRRQRTALALATFASVMLLCLAVAAGWLAVTAYRERDRALLSQSRYLTDLANRRLSEGDPVTAMLLSLEALPDTRHGRSRPFYRGAEASLLRALQARRDKLSLIGTIGRPEFVTAKDGKAAFVVGTMWGPFAADAGTGRPIGLASGARKTDETPFKAAYWTSSPSKRWHVEVEDLHIWATISIWETATGIGPLSFTLAPEVGPRSYRSEGYIGREIGPLDRDHWLLAIDDGLDRAVLADPSGGPLQLFNLQDPTFLLPEDEKLKIHAATAKLDMSSDDALQISFDLAGRQLIAAATDGRIRLFDAGDGHALGDLEGHTKAVTGFVSDDTGRLIVSYSADATARVWSLDTRQQIVLLEGHDGAVVGAAVPPGLKTIATFSTDRTVRVWDAATGRQRAVLRLEQGDPTAAAFDATGRRLAIGSSAGMVRIWDWQALGPPITLDLPRDRPDRHPIEALAFSPDGSRLAVKEIGKTEFRSTERSGRAWLTDVSPAAALVLGGLPGESHGLTFSPDSARVAVALDDGSWRMWAAATGAKLMEAVTPPPSRAAAAPIEAPSADPRAPKGDLDSTRERSPREQAALRRRNRYEAFGRVAIGLSPDGERVATVLGSGLGRVWAIRGGNVQLEQEAITDASVLVAESDGSDCVQHVFAPNESLSAVRKGDPDPDLPSIRIAACSGDGRSAIFHRRDPESTLRLDVESGSTTSISMSGLDSGSAIQLSGDGKLLARGLDGHNLSLIDVLADRDVSSFYPDDTREGDRDPERGSDQGPIIRFVPQSGRVLFVNRIGATLWNRSTGTLTRMLSGHESDITVAETDKQGSFIVTGTERGSIRLFDAKTGVLVAILDDHSDAITALEFSPDGKYLASSSRDATVRLWEMPTVLSRLSGAGWNTLPASHRFRTTQDLIDYSLTQLSFCFSRRERERLALEKDMPAWCEAESYSSDDDRPRVKAGTAK